MSSGAEAGGEGETANGPGGGEAASSAAPQKREAAAAAAAVPAQAGEPGAAGEPGVGGSGNAAAPESVAAAAMPARTAQPAHTPEPADPAQAARRAGRRELTVTVLTALLGGVLAWTAAGRSWATGVAGEAPNTLKVAASGNDLSAGVTALGLTALAGALALFATQRLARRLVGVLLIAAGAGAAVYAFGERGTAHASRVLAQKAAAKGFATRAVDAHLASWWVLAVVGGVLVVLAGAVAVVRGASWPGMSSRYENAATKAAVRAADTGSAKDLWDALDRGEDPTEPVAPLTSTPRAEH